MSGIKDKGAFEKGASVFAPVGGIVDDVSSTTVNEDETGTVRITSKRAVHANLRDSSGNELGTGSSPLATSASTMSTLTVIDRNSTVGGQRLLASQTYTSSWIDTNGYGGLYFFFVDNTSGGGGCAINIEWSSDGGATSAYQGAAAIYIVGGLGPTFEVEKNSWITIRARYFRITQLNNIVDQGTVSPNFSQLVFTLFPAPFASDAVVTNTGTTPVPVRGTEDVGLMSLPVVCGGVDNPAAPTLSNPLKVTANGIASVSGDSTAYTGNAMVTAGKLFATASPGNTSVTVAAASTQVFASNTDRLGFSIYNEGGAMVKLKRGTAASATSFDWILQPYDFLYVDGPGYSGAVHHIGDVAVGTLRCCEW